MVDQDKGLANKHRGYYSLNSIDPQSAPLTVYDNGNPVGQYVTYENGLPVLDDGTVYHPQIDITGPVTFALYYDNGSGLELKWLDPDYLPGEPVLKDQVTLTYDLISDVIADDTLIIGDSVKWLGYYTVGDGGGNQGYIVAGGTGTADGGSFFDMNNGLQVQTIFDRVTPEMFGAMPGTIINPSFFVTLAGYTNEIDLNNKTWLFDLNLTLPAGKHYTIKNGVMDFSASTADIELITVTGTGFSNDTNFTANKQYPDIVVSVADATGYSIGDVIQLKSSGQWSVNTLQSEFAVISNIVGNDITVEGSVLGDYKTSEGAHVRLFDTSTGIFLDNVEIIGNRGNNQTGLRCKYTSNSGWGNDVIFRDCVSQSVLMETSVYCNGSGVLTCYNSDREGLGYALNTVGSQWCNFGDITGINCRHVTTTGDSSGSEALARWQSYGNIIGIGSRDAIVDTHDGAVDFTYNSISGTLKFGNSADDGVTMEGARIQIGSINISNVERFGLYVNFLGMGDTGRESYLTVDSCVVEGKTNGDYIALMQNVSGALGHRMDSLIINSITGSAQRGINVEAEDGDIDYVKINANISTVDDHSIEIISGTGRVKDCDISGVVNHGSTNTSHYPVFIDGNTWSLANGDAIATRCVLNDIRLINSGSATTALRNFSSDVNLFGFWFEGGYTTPIINSGVGITRKGDAQITKQTFAFNPGNITTGTQITTTVTVAGVEFGDFVDATWDEDPFGLEIFGFISATDTVTVVFKNDTGGDVNLDPGNIIVRSN
jgi:hypothetical protein